MWINYGWDCDTFYIATKLEKFDLQFIVTARTVLSFSGWLSANTNTHVIKLVNDIAAALIWQLWLVILFMRVFCFRQATWKSQYLKNLVFCIYYHVICIMCHVLNNVVTQQYRSYRITNSVVHRKWDRCCKCVLAICLADTSNFIVSIVTQIGAKLK